MVLEHYFPPVRVPRTFSTSKTRLKTLYLQLQSIFLSLHVSQSVSTPDPRLRCDKCSRAVFRAHFCQLGQLHDHSIFPSRDQTLCQWFQRTLYSARSSARLSWDRRIRSLEPRFFYARLPRTVSTSIMQIKSLEQWFQSTLSLCARSSGGLGELGSEGLAAVWVIAGGRVAICAPMVIGVSSGSSSSPSSRSSSMGVRTSVGWTISSGFLETSYKI